MRIHDVPKPVDPRSVDEAQLSPVEVRGIFVGFDLGFFPTRGELCSLLGRAANLLAAWLFEPEPSSSVGSIVDFGDGRPGGVAKGKKSIVDFGDGRPVRSGPGNKSIVDFGDRPASIVDFGDGKVTTD